MPTTTITIPGGVYRGLTIEQASHTGDIMVSASTPDGHDDRICLTPNQAFKLSEALKTLVLTWELNHGVTHDPR